MTTINIYHNENNLGHVAEGPDPEASKAIAVSAMEDAYTRSGAPGLYKVVRDNVVLASINTEPIMGRIVLQRWEGVDDEYCETVREEMFDATHHILGMNYDEFKQIADSDESSDDIGHAHVDWTGPCEVYIEEAIANYFGGLFGNLSDITRENFEYVKGRFNPQPPAEMEVELVLKIRVAVQPGVDPGDLTDHVTYTMGSKTPGIVIQAVDRVEATVTAIGGSPKRKPC